MKITGKTDKFNVVILFVLMLSLLEVLLLSLPHDSEASTAMNTMENTVNEVLGVLKDPDLKGDGNRDIKKEKIWVIIDKAFNYDLLARQALGKIWKTISNEQQHEFTKLYSKLLGNTYIDRILSYGDESVDIEREIPLADKIAEVQTVISYQERKIPVFYRLNFENGTWKVFDVVIEGVSMTKNYRSQFKDFLSKKSMDDLLNVLNKKSQAGN
ncbi:Toluene tolerance protein [Desulfamplus magnetovallimortis]|uniref:Toluene tolerance protein n=1 Tax=Desulfamplus magnetovallimortis TaxID=1246637 RepID=A0A1W1H6K7_9BACT|nr:ABC transporter substrate-binding protein [Desulfamplus magnetovallimortis]SLM28120.1 Toluene tolerance protein [Desulfamplus magnetovallimortis]